MTKFPLLRIDVHTGVVHVLSPGGVIIASLSREDQQYIAQVVVSASQIPPSERQPGRTIEVLFGEREPNRLLKLD